MFKIKKEVNKEEKDIKEKNKNVKNKKVKNKKEVEPEFYMSVTNIKTLNYNVYYMKTYEKIIYFLIAFIVGVFVGYLFYGGIGKDQFGNPTKITKILNRIIPSIVGFIAGILYVPAKKQGLLLKRKKGLKLQFRDMLDGLTTSLGSGKNIVDSFKGVKNDMLMQYEPDSYIIKELEVIISGIENNIDIEDTLIDFGSRSGIEDIKDFANIFKITYRKGGNIKDIIRNTNSILSDKMDIAEEIETIVTSNKMEQKIMAVMPLGIIGIIKYMSPDLAENFVKGPGLISTTIAIGMFIISYFVSRSLLDIKI